MNDADELEARVRALLAAGDVRAAVDAAIRGVGPRVLRYLRSVLRDEDLAAEASSVFAEDLCRGLPEFRFDASLRTWALHIAWHACLRVRDDGWRRRAIPLSRGPASRLAEALRVADTPMRLEGRARQLELIRAKLTMEEQSLLALRLDQRLPWSEVARVLARNGEVVQVAALQQRFHRLKDRLARLARELERDG